MRKTIEERRLNAIRLKFKIFPRKCKICDDEVSFEKMWTVDRWGINKTVHEWCYCTKCMKSKEDVLKRIDTDKTIFGIAFVDDF